MKKQTVSMLVAALVCAVARAAGADGQTHLYWGDLHLHTNYSIDAYATGNLGVTPEMAYRFARGIPIDNPNLGTKIQMRRPLDFLAVTDHAEMLGMEILLKDKDPRVLATEWGRKMLALRQDPRSGGVMRAQNNAKCAERKEMLQQLASPVIRQATWESEIAAAEKNYVPGTFTTLIGWEWTAMPDGGKNLHRCVISDADGEAARAFVPFSNYESIRPEDLWRFLKQTKARTGIDFLAIPHNSNLSGGLMFDMVDSDGHPLSDRYVREEALFREASAMGLAEGDYVIRRRLVQKMLYLLDDTATESFAPNDAALLGYLHAHEDRYREAPTITFTQVFLEDAIVRPEGGERAAERLKRELEAHHVGFDRAPRYGDRPPYLQNYIRRTAAFVENQLGANFASHVTALQPSDHWQGPDQVELWLPPGVGETARGRTTAGAGADQTGGQRRSAARRSRCLPREGHQRPDHTLPGTKDRCRNRRGRAGRGCCARCPLAVGDCSLMRTLRLAVLSLVAAWLIQPLASAHDARPLSVDIKEQSAGLYEARIRVPPTVTDDDLPVLVWPADCRVVSEHRVPPPTPQEVVMVACAGGGLEGQTLRAQVLPPEAAAWSIPRESTWMRVALSYLELGIRHIWTGFDHLLFVTGLLVLAGTLRRVILAITGFTLAHSVTLSLSALGLVRLPSAPVEAAIALSILFLAWEIARPLPQSLARRYPLLVSCAFGLLHGFGFAAALREVGLPTDELAVALLCFNLGVEVGQIVFIVAVLALLVPAARAAGRISGLAGWQARPEIVWGYALGVPATFWFFQRLGAL